MTRNPAPLKGIGHLKLEHRPFVNVVAPAMHKDDVADAEDGAALAAELYKVAKDRAIAIHAPDMQENDEINPFYGFSRISRILSSPNDKRLSVEENEGTRMASCSCCHKR